VGSEPPPTGCAQAPSPLLLITDAVLSSRVAVFSISRYGSHLTYSFRLFLIDVRCYLAQNVRGNVAVSYPYLPDSTDAFKLTRTTTISVPQPARGRTGRQLGGGLVTSRCSSRRTPCVRAELNRNWSWCTAAHVVAQETTVSDLATTQSGAVLLQRQHDSSLGRLAQSSLQEQSPSYSAVRACITFSPPLPHSSPSLRARSPRRSRKGYANRKETERERSSGDSKRTREESRQRREEVHFSPFGFPDSHGAMSERRRHLCACCCEVLVSTLARERRGGGERREGGRGGTGSMPPPLPLLCSSVFLLLLLCRPSLANGRAIRLDASSPEPSPQFVKGSVASSTVTASPPAGRLAPAGCVVGS
jgi:hypothetical protein